MRPIVSSFGAGFGQVLRAEPLILQLPASKVLKHFFGAVGPCSVISVVAGTLVGGGDVRVLQCFSPPRGRWLRFIEDERASGKKYRFEKDDRPCSACSLWHA